MLTASVVTVVNMQTYDSGTLNSIHVGEPGIIDSARYEYEYFGSTNLARV